MADTAVSPLIARLISLLTEEAKLLRGIHGEVADIKDELESIQIFLKDADARAAAEEDISDGAKTWVKQVREVAFHIDVAIDQYLLHEAKHDPRRLHFTGFFPKITHLLKTFNSRHEIATKIQEIKASVQKIKDRSKRYSFKSIDQGSSSGARNDRWHDPRKDSFYLDDADVVGIESPRDELIGWLVEGLPYRSVLSVVGMGGLGKTTLAKKVYDHQKVRGHFDCHAWIPVSQSYNTEHLLRSMIKQFCKARMEYPPQGLDEMDEELLINELRNYLQQKRVFQFDFGGHCPPALENLSHNIVEKCKGLPLAIVAIGGLLSTKDKTIFEWQNLHDGLGIELGRNPHLVGVDKILSLSYEDLPYNLKSCFLYLGMYPEDYSINCVRLIRQWIAEGFVKKIEGKTVEEIAREYLTELIHRSLVQVSIVDFDGKVRRCRLHDLLREIVLQKMKDLSFCHVLSKKELSFEGLTRRVSIDRGSYSVLKGFKDKHIHSILLFNLDELPKSFMITFFADFKLLKVMDFEDAPLYHIPEDMGSLFHLRYLSFRNTKVNVLPKSIGKLQNLETLDLKQTLICDIPVEINKLGKLRHFLAYNRDYKKDFNLTWQKGVKIQKGVGCLKSLQKLYYVKVNHGGIDLIEELGKLKQLKKLGIQNMTTEIGRAFCASIQNMKDLQSLEVSSICEDEIIDLQSMSSPPQFLQRLHISGRLDKLPDWIPKLQHLVRLRMFWSRLEDDPLKALQNLPNLLQLTFSRQAYDGEQLHFKTGGFLKLKELGLHHLNGLYSLMIDEGALPLLEMLSIGPTPQLKEVPSGIHHLKNLKQLNFWGYA
uniref:Rx N-terminal domain-containing protein n=1 Tax=Fagus sylvatica TaxID=28930 RepID=A0A2N9HXF7_FAGSY